MCSVIVRAASAVLFLTLFASGAEAQLMGANALGDFGVLSATQPDPGFYLAGVYGRYDTKSVRNGDGNEISFPSDADPSSLDVNIGAAFAWWVADARILGGDYSALAVLPFANSRLQVPALGADLRTEFGIGDAYLRPVNLGWHRERADFMAGVGLTFPTGRYDDADKGDTGSGMWTFELLAGATLYFDRARRWHFSTTAYWETHTEKKDSDVKVGDLLTLEGGLGTSFLEGALTVGAAYYAQWKLTDDDFGVDVMLPAGLSIGKHRVYGLGPDVSIPIVTGSRLWATVTARYMWDLGARTTTSGQRLWVYATFLIPPVSVS